MNLQTLDNEIFGETKPGCCINCKQPFHFSGVDNGELGNIYSEAGLRETEISHLCESCFDRITEPVD